MSAPYLNRGESIILTTHRVSVNSALFDAMLTNERLILIDSRYIRFEPRMILFPGVISIKGGKAPAGEPAIIFTLEEPSDLSGSQQINLIFNQQPGEHRTHERELWMKKLIELVITAREQAAQKTLVPVRKQTGMQPAIRRWVAPEPLRPHSSVIEPTPPLPAVEVTSDEPDSLEFFLEHSHEDKGTPEEEHADVTQAPEILSSTVGTAGITEEEPEVPEPVTSAGVLPGESEPVYETPEGAETLPPEAITGAEPSRLPESAAAGPLPAAMPAPPASPEPAEDDGPLVPFESTVLAAVSALESSTRSQKQPEVSAATETEETGPVAAPETPAYETLHAQSLDIAGHRYISEEKIPVPDAGRREEPGPAPVAVLAQVRELPGTYTPGIPPTGIATGPGQDSLLARSPGLKKKVKDSRMGKPAIIAIAILIVAIVALFGGAALITLHGQPAGNPGVVTSTAITVAQTPSPVPVTVPPTGVLLKVIYPGAFTGMIGNPGVLRQVSGTGNQTYQVLMTASIVQAAIQKHDNSGAAMTVEIYNNGTLLSRRTVTAPMGEVDLLIDTKTAQPPGLTTPPAGNRTLPGNGTLVYY